MDVLAKIELEALSGIPRDNASMQLSFHAESNWTSTLSDGLFAAINRFFNEPLPSASFNLGNYMSPALKHTSTAGFVRFYNITGKLAPTGFVVKNGKRRPVMPLVGSPIETRVLGLTDAAAGSQPMPAQVTLRATLRALAWDVQPVEVPDDEDEGTEPTRPRSRYTGGVLVGPLSDLTRQVVNGEAIPTAAIRTYVGDGLKRLADEVTAIEPAGNQWLGVWSRMGGVIRPVENIQVGDRFGTARRRARRVLTRNTLTVDAFD